MIRPRSKDEKKEANERDRAKAEKMAARVSREQLARLSLLSTTNLLRANSILRGADLRVKWLVNGSDLNYDAFTTAVKSTSGKNYKRWLLSLKGIFRNPKFEETEMALATFTYAAIEKVDSDGFVTCLELDTTGSIEGNADTIHLHIGEIKEPLHRNCMSPTQRARSLGQLCHQQTNGIVAVRKGRSQPRRTGQLLASLVRRGCYGDEVKNARIEVHATLVGLWAGKDANTTEWETLGDGFEDCTFTVNLVDARRLPLRIPAPRCE